MPGSNTRKSKTLKVNKKAELAKKQQVPQFINSGIEDLEAAADKLAGVYQAFNEAYYKEFGLTAAKKAADKAFALVENAIEMSKKNKHYDAEAGPWTGQL